MSKTGPVNFFAFFFFSPPFFFFEGGGAVWEIVQKEEEERVQCGIRRIKRDERMNLSLRPLLWHSDNAGLSQAYTPYSYMPTPIRILTELNRHAAGHINFYLLID